MIQQHYNKPQLRSLLIDAPSEIFIAGRGTGKTTKVGAKKTAINYLDGLPRGTHAIVGATFTQLYTRTLKELIRGWQELGYIMDHHFIVGKQPPEKWKRKWNWKGPYAPPIDYKHFISWWNGSVAQMVSMERSGSANGTSFASIFGDEAKFLDEERFNTEILPANRGLIKEFEHNPNHHGVTLITDMPVGTSGRWLLDKSKAMDQQAVNKIWQLQVVRFKLDQQLRPKASKQQVKEIDKQILIIDDEMRKLRFNLLYYHEASTLDNIHALGADYIKQQIRDTSKFQFDTQILNIRPNRLEDGFYPDIDETYHGYYAETASFFDAGSFNMGTPMDCRKDSDHDPNKPLHIAIDYNKRIHPMVICQDDGESIRFINAMHVLAPDKLAELLVKFNKYYQSRTNRLIYYWHDHTSVGGENPTSKSDDVIAALRKAEWTVIPMYIGKISGHEDRYNMYGHLFKEDGKYKRKLRFNRENCQHLITSINLCGTELRKDGFGKNKKPEHDDKYPAEEAPHYSDAMDQMMDGMFEKKIPYQSASTTTTAATADIPSFR